MSSEENPPVPNGQVLEQPSVLSRVASLPLVTSTCHLVVSAYTSTKETNPYLKSVCDAAEKGAKTLTEAALCGARPLVTRLEPQIATASLYACKGLDKLEEKLPILQQPPEVVVSEAKEFLSNKVTGAQEAVSGTVRGATGVVSGGVSGMMGVAKGVAQGSVEITRSVVAGGVNSILGSRVGELVATSVDAVMGKSEDLVEYYLPMADQELAEPAASGEGVEAGTVALEKEQRARLVRLASLSSKLRLRLIPHFLAKWKGSGQALALMELVKHGVGQTLRSGQERLLQMWLVWSQVHAGNAKELDSSAPPEVESWTLATFRRLTRQLQLSYGTLVAQLQDKAKSIRHTAEDLGPSSSAARPFQEAPSAILLQGCQRITKARGSVDEIVDYVVQNVPLPWVVGPFAPSLVERPDTENKTLDSNSGQSPRREQEKNF